MTLQTFQALLRQSYFASDWYEQQQPTGTMPPCML